jgi:hypothetical protein
MKGLPAGDYRPVRTGSYSFQRQWMTQDAFLQNAKVLTRVLCQPSILLGTVVMYAVSPLLTKCVAISARGEVPYLLQHSMIGRRLSSKVATAKATPAFSSVVPSGDDKPRLVCNHCDFIRYENPLLVCGVVASVNDKILLVRRDIEPRKGYWTIPGGYMECGESTEQGVCQCTCLPKLHSSCLVALQLLLVKQQRRRALMSTSKVC